MGVPQGTPVAMGVEAPVEVGVSLGLESELREYGAPAYAGELNAQNVGVPLEYVSGAFPGTSQPAMRATSVIGRVPQVTPVAVGVDLPVEVDVEVDSPALESKFREYGAPTDVGEVEVPISVRGSIEPNKVSRVLDFCEQLGQVKDVKRAYRTACMCLSLNPTDGLDQTKCMKMALIKDLGVSTTGDVVTAGLNPDDITREERFLKEQDAIHKIASSLGGVGGAEIVYLWRELQKGETPEALYVRDMNKLDMVMQADTYEQTQAVRLDDFFNTTSNAYKTSLFQSLDAEVRTRRARRTEGSVDR